eukprot:m.312642 g.312642  ORF g.312642 m.312642 type:complete len:77 (+) comp291922_c0_seq1:241-471(+)
MRPRLRMANIVSAAILLTELTGEKMALRIKGPNFSARELHCLSTTAFQITSHNWLNNIPGFRVSFVDNLLFYSSVA